MATKVAQKRLQKEYLAMQKQPPPFIWASPEEKNILDFIRARQLASVSIPADLAKANVSISSWNAAWSVATILTGLLSFMLSDEITAGAVKSTLTEKKQLAAQSHAFNLSSKKFRDIFPIYATPSMTDLPDMGQQAAASSSAAAINPDKPLAALSASSLLVSGASSPPPLPMTIPNHTNTIQPKPHRARWRPGWRLVIAAIVVAVLGRLSTLAGL
ncbi:hypothetical protein P7C73_g979, partial [Tremellales sp. Uapishka_1]